MKLNYLELLEPLTMIETMYVSTLSKAIEINTPRLSLLKTNLELEKLLNTEDLDHLFKVGELVCGKYYYLTLNRQNENNPLTSTVKLGNLLEELNIYKDNVELLKAYIIHIQNTSNLYQVSNYLDTPEMKVEDVQIDSEVPDPTKNYLKWYKKTPESTAVLKVFEKGQWMSHSQSVHSTPNFFKDMTPGYATMQTCLKYGYKFLND